MFCVACVLDISFVVDHSSSIRDSYVDGEDNWQRILDFMLNVALRFYDIAAETHIAAVSFGITLCSGLISTL